MISGSRPPRSRRFLAVVALGIALIVAVSAVSGLWAFHLGWFASPSGANCSIPGGPNGTECYDGVDYQFETVAVPGDSRTSNVSFAGDAFVLWTTSNNASSYLFVNGTEPSGYHASLALAMCCFVGPRPWQTEVSPDGHFGVQAGSASAGVRLLVET